MVGEKVTNRLLGETFFAHFCAGETAQQVGERASSLRALGVGGILDYAAEVDLESPDQGARTIDGATRESSKDGRPPREACDVRLTRVCSEYWDTVGRAGRSEIAVGPARLRSSHGCGQHGIGFRGSFHEKTRRWIHASGGRRPKRLYANPANVRRRMVITCTPKQEDYCTVALAL